MPPRTAVMVLAAMGTALVAGCGLGTSLEGDWVGTVAADPGFTCPGPTTATLRVIGDHFLFAPTSGVIVLRGTILPDNSGKAQASTIGMDHKPFPLAFTGQFTPTRITGTYLTPTCRAQVSLHPAS
jgi:hypothetical protein